MIILEKAIYIHEPCPACHFVEDNFLETIKDRYELIEFDLQYQPDRENKYVEMWSNVTRSIPTIIIEGKKAVNYYIGAKGIKTLYEKCQNWEERDMRVRKHIEPVKEKPEVIGKDTEAKPDSVDVEDIIVQTKKVIV